MWYCSVALVDKSQFFDDLFAISHEFTPDINSNSISLENGGMPKNRRPPQNMAEVAAKLQNNSVCLITVVGDQV